MVKSLTLFNEEANSMALNNNIINSTEMASLAKKGRLISQANRQQARQRQRSMLMRSTQGIRTSLV